MHSSLRRGIARLVVVASIGVASPFWAGCSVEDTSFTGPDAQQQPATATLTVARDGAAAGTVSSSAGGIDCGGACSASFAVGTQVTLTATPGTGAAFTGWSGGGCSGAAATCTVTVGADTTVTATFDVARYAVTVDLGGMGAGQVVAPGSGISCPGACSAMIAHGSVLLLAATADASSRFMGWTVGPGGTACADTGACQTTITGPTTIVATFALLHALEVTRSGNGTGTVRSTPGGIDCGTDCSELYLPGTTVTLAATAAADSTFAGWSGGGCTGTGACTVDVGDAVMVTADFRLKQYELTVTKDGTGAGTVTSAPAGIDCGADCSETVDHGAMVTLTAVPSVGSAFLGWSGVGCPGTGDCTVTVTAATAVTASFARNAFALAVSKSGTGAGTVTSSPAGISCGADCSETYPQGATVTLTATPSTGSTFAGWSGAGCSGTGTCTVTMAADTAVTALFTFNRYALGITKTGSGDGDVVSSPAGVVCGGTCTALFDHGTVVTLTATPAANSIFGGWNGGGCSGTGTCTITLTADTLVGASFQRPSWTLAVTKAGTGAGTVTSSPGIINCGATCSQVVPSGSTYTLTATPAAGSTFAGWSGGGCTGTGTCSVSVTADTTVTAMFTLNQYALAVMKTGSGGGGVVSAPAGVVCGGTCTTQFAHGTVVTLTATPATNSIFGGWNGGGCSGTGTCTVTMTADTIVGANFQRPSWTLAVAKAGTGAGTVTSSPGSINCGSTCSQVALNGSTFTLTATPAAGSVFTGWSGGGCTGTGTCSVSVTADTTVTATFALVQTLSVTKAGTGDGTVTSSPAGISCGADCSEPYATGTTVTLTATPSTGSTFAGWSGGGCSGTGTCTVTLTAATAVTATFAINLYRLEVIKTGSGGGSISFSPSGTPCGSSCSQFPHGTTVTITATPANTSAFGGWSGGGCSGTGTCTRTMTSDVIMGASFTELHWVVTIVKTGTGTGTVTSSPGGINCGTTCSGVVIQNRAVFLSAVPNTGSVFSGWSGGGCSGTGTCTTVFTADTTVTAIFSAAVTSPSTGTTPSPATAPVAVAAGTGREPRAQIDR